MQLQVNGLIWIPIWSTAPILRLLLPFCIGVVLQQYFQLPVLLSFLALMLVSPLLLLLMVTKPPASSPWFGCLMPCAMAAAGCLVVYAKDLRHHPLFIADQYKTGMLVQAVLKEPPAEKNRSFKAVAAISVFENNHFRQVAGDVILYFRKDTSGAIPHLEYGSRVLFQKPLLPIRNAGNPGGFDYARYCSFHEIYFQTFLQKIEYVILPGQQQAGFRQSLFRLQAWVVGIFKTFIPSPKEAGMASALLIGYKNDLDPDLVQHYSNTGVVHIIAISGMHLGLIYGLLLLVFRPFGNGKRMLYFRAIAIISLLWIFTLLTGAAPSIVRSAIMFTSLVAGDTRGKKASVYNSLAASAFFILLADPFALWDAGFQLSYAALLSIAVFSRAIRSWFFIENRWLRHIWELVAVTMAAQIITYPIVAWHFHQFPNLFLLTNIVAVPLSSLILYMLILLLMVAGLNVAAIIIGKITCWLISCMNAFIQLIDKIPFALTGNILFTVPEVIALYLLIIGVAQWLLRRSATALMFAAWMVSCLVLLRSFDFFKVSGQQKLVVYNTAGHTAIDIFSGHQYQFLGDTTLLNDGQVSRFVLAPSRVIGQAERSDAVRGVHIGKTYIQAGSTKILRITQPIPLLSTPVNADLVIISGNPPLKLEQLTVSIRTPLIVADASNSYHKISQWQKEAQTLHLRLYSVGDTGAFCLNWHGP